MRKMIAHALTPAPVNAGRGDLELGINRDTSHLK